MPLEDSGILPELRHESFADTPCAHGNAETILGRRAITNQQEAADEQE
jgi:hypothetical protein